MKILYVINDLSSVGGAENLLINLVQKSNINQKKYILVLGDISSANCNILNKYRVEYLALLKNNYSLLIPFYIFNFVKKNKIDIVHINLFPSLYFGVFSLFLTKNIKLIYTEHSTHNKRRNFLLFRFFDKFVYNRLDSIICISEGVKEALLQWQPQLLNKITVVANGVNIKLPIINDVDVEDTPIDAKILLMIARFTPAKDHKTLIKALSYLNDSVHLWLVGDGETLDDCKKIVKDLELCSRVHFIGKKLNIYDYISKANICVLSSYWEGFGLSAVECMIAKKPTLVSNIPGLSNIIPDKYLLFRPQDSIELSDKINALLNDNVLYEKMAYGCYRRALEYDVKYTVSQYSSVYSTLLTT